MGYLSDFAFNGREALIKLDSLFWNLQNRTICTSWTKFIVEYYNFWTILYEKGSSIHYKIDSRFRNNLYIQCLWLGTIPTIYIYVLNINQIHFACDGETVDF